MPKKNEEIKIEKVAEENKEIEERAIPDHKTKDYKNLAYIIIGLIVIFICIFGGFQLYNYLHKDDYGKLKDVDQLHELNRQGKLDYTRGYMFNGFSFVKSEGLWWTEITAPNTGRLIKAPLHFGPREVEFIKVTGTLSPLFNRQNEVYIAIDPNVTDKFYTLSLSELSMNVAKGIGRIPVGSCTKEDPACENRTIIDCKNAQGKAVVQFSLADRPEVELSGTCIQISGKEYNLVRATDRALLKWYGILE